MLLLFFLAFQIGMLPIITAITRNDVLQLVLVYYGYI